MGTVMVKGTPYVIVDICLRMLKPSEPSRPMASRPTTSSATAPTASRSPRLVHMCGSGISPPPMAALARANDPCCTEQCQARAA